MDRSKNLLPAFSHFDFPISNLLSKAIVRVRKPTKARHASSEHVLDKFVKAMEFYILYGQTSDQDYYKKAIVGFAKVPFLEKIKLSEDFTPLLRLVQKITNIICINYKHLYIPPGDIIKQMILLVQALKQSSNTESIIEANTAVTDQEQNKSKLTTDCRRFLKSKENFVRTVDTQIENSRQVMNSNAVETELRNDLFKALQSALPNHKLHIFGSRASGQALEDSDFDFYCDVTGKNYVLGMTIKNQRKYVGMVGGLLKRKTLGGIFEEVNLVRSARVPIVKLVHKTTTMDCDIGFKDGSGVENTKLLKLYLDLDPRVRWVLTAVKLWADDNNIKNNRYFRSHGLTWLVLFYLMTTKLVPPFKELQKNCQPKIINGWNTAFKDPKDWWVPDTEASPLELFKGFLFWVVLGDLTANVLSPYTGELIPKKSFKKMTWLKNNYKGLVMNGNSGLCIHDAIEHDQNIVTDIKDLLYSNFIDLCCETISMLAEH